MDAKDKEELLALAQELANVGRENEKGGGLSFKDGADVVYKILGIAVVIIGLVLWLASNRGDINRNSDGITVLRSDYRLLEERVRVVERSVTKLEK